LGEADTPQAWRVGASLHEGPHAEEIPDAVKARVSELRGEVVRGERKVPAE
jgi:hypothetical protein